MPVLLCIIRCTSDFAMRSCAESSAPGNRCRPAARSRRSWRSRAFPSSTRIHSFMSRDISGAGKAPAPLCLPRWFRFMRMERLLSQSPAEYARYRGVRPGFLNSGTIHGGVVGAPSQSINRRWNVSHSKPGQSLSLATAARRALMRFAKLIRLGSCRSAMLSVLTCAPLVPFVAILSRS